MVFNVVLSRVLEDRGLPPEIQAQCQHIVSLEAVNTLSYNVAVAGSLVMYSRVYGGCL
jgi:tRNA G18 (ribose-2'-O)-methylase SpoU